MAPCAFACGTAPHAQGTFLQSKCCPTIGAPTYYKLGIGTIILGDMNVHHTGWLTHSANITPEGRALFKFCAYNGIAQCVDGPTRRKYLLDLVLTDAEE